MRVESASLRAHALRSLRIAARSATGLPGSESLPGRSLPLRIGAALAGAALWAGAAALAAPDELGFVRVAPEQIQWTSPNGPDAPQVALIEGDPTKPGIYVQRNRFPPGVFSLPHAHDQDRHVLVIQGSWYTGTGERFDPASAVRLGPGSYMKHPAGAAHWDGSGGAEEVIVQITGVGPVKTTTAPPGGDRYIKVSPAAE
jgi:quercetin dioxygenase-like cupin family protein